MLSLMSRQTKLHTMIFALVGLLAPLSAHAQWKPQITTTIDENSRAKLTASIPAEVAKATDLGRVSGDLEMKDMVLLLQPADAQKKALETFLTDVQNPSSPNFHKFLSPADFGAAYGPAQADVDTIKGWLTSQGFKVEGVAVARNWIRFSGSASAVESAFGTQIHNYQSAGMKRISNATELTIPSALQPVVTSLLSVNSFLKPSFHTPVGTVTRDRSGKLVRVPQTVAPDASTPAGDNLVPQYTSPQFTSQGQPEQVLLAPGDFAKIYNSAALVAGGTNGAGVSIAIVGRSDISLSDVETFRTLFKLPYNDPIIIQANGDPGVVAGDDEEAILDVEWSGAVAPLATIKYVIGASTITTDGVDISAAYIVDNKVAPIMSVSYGRCEQMLAPSELLFYNNLWQQAAAEGISVFVSSGDNGSSGCLNQNVAFASNVGLGVSGLASTPYNTAVGGTEFNDAVLNTYWTPTVNADQSSAKGYVPEFVWNETCNVNAPTTAFNCYFEQAASAPAYAGSGGASTCSTHSATASVVTGLYTCTSGYTKPTWQIGNGVPSDGLRDIPDVSLAAAGGHDGFLLCYNGSCQYTTQPDGSLRLTQASVIGGTSASSPSMAGVMALVEQKNGQFQGLANPKLYALAAAQTGNCNSSAQTDPTQTNPCVFHDVTEGSNSMTCIGTLPGCSLPLPGTTTFKQLTGWSAGAGYDLATGLGSVNVANLVGSWGSITQAPTTTALTLSATTFTHGTPITVTSTTTPSSGTGTPTGSIELSATGKTSTAGPVLASSLTAGVYSAPVSSLPGGTYALTSLYGGDVAFAPSTSAPVNVTVAPEASVINVTTLVPSRFFILGRRRLLPGTSGALNGNFYISLNLAGASGAGIPSGTVTITQGSSSVGTFTLDKNGAIYVPCGPYTVCDYAIGAYTFTAAYSGDSSFNPTTQTFPFTITMGTANFSTTVDRQIVVVNTPIQATVSINYDPAVLPTGTVSIFRTDTNATLGTAPVGANGQANIAFLAPLGVYGVNATWTGDANYTAGFGSSYPNMNVTAVPNTIATSAALTVPVLTSSLGQRTSFTVAISPASRAPNGALPTGTVTLFSRNYGTVSPAVNITGGSATLFVQWPLAGAVDVYAVYSGDNNYAGSTTGSVTVNVSQATAVVTLSTVAPYVATGGQDSIIATLTTGLAKTSAPAPKGSVQFFDAFNGAAPVSLGSAPLNAGLGGTIVATVAPSLAAGTHLLTASYTGDANYSPSTAINSVQILSTPPDFVLSAPSSMPLVAGQSGAVAIGTTSILGFNTPVAVSCAGTLPEGVTCGTTSITPGQNGVLTLNSVAPGTLSAFNHSQQARPWAIGGTIFAGLALLCLPRRRRLAALVMLLVASSITLFSITGCGGSSPATTQLALTSSNTKIASGTAVSLQATLHGTTKPTGTVTFLDAGATLGSASVSNGTAVLSAAALSVGTHAITAMYSGDNANTSAKSADTLEQTVTGTFNLTVTATAGSATHTAMIPVTLQ